MGSSKEKSVSESIAILAISIFGILLKAFVFKMYWDWFVAEPFHIHSISKWHAYALVCLLQFVVSDDRDILKEEPDNEVISLFGKRMFLPAYLLLFGYLVKTFWMA